MDIRKLGPGDTQAYRQMMALFAEVFAEDGGDAYNVAPPDDDYVAARLADPMLILLTAWQGGAMVGALAAYELAKYEQARREIYIYDLAVRSAARRQGIATALIERTRAIARDQGAWTVFVQADYRDPPAIALYEKLGRREEVLHFDIDPG